jgi:EXS family
VEQDYLDIFYNRGNRKEGQNELRKILQGRLISQYESFFFGFFFGLCVSFILLMWAMIWIGDLSADDDELFKNVFPLFRGIGLLILYVWLLAWNVYGWIAYNVNYKLIFNFRFHYSTISEVNRLLINLSTIRS